MRRHLGHHREHPSVGCGALMAVARPGLDRDLLTRTTLRLGLGPETWSLTQVVNALQRVPGVLTVEADAVHAPALVAHDAAVPFAALVAAVSSLGAAAKIVADPGTGPRSAVTTASAFRWRLLRLVMLVVVAQLAVIIVDTAFPDSREKRWLSIVSLLV